MRKFLFAPIVLALASFAATSEAAVSLKLDGYQVGALKGSGVTNVNTFRVMGFQVNPATIVTTDNAGQFYGSLSSGYSFTAFCVELDQGLSPFPTAFNSYTDVKASVALASPKYASGAYDRVARLYSENNTLDTVDKTAAFQIAIWEALFETSGVFKVGDGTANLAGSADFRTVTGGTANAATFAQAQTYLDAMAATVINPKLDLVVYQNATMQDVIVSVPEPETYALMLAGLIGMGALASRRARKQS